MPLVIVRTVMTTYKLKIKAFIELSIYELCGWSLNHLIYNFFFNCYASLITSSKGIKIKRDYVLDAVETTVIEHDCNCTDQFCVNGSMFNRCVNGLLPLRLTNNKS